MDDGTVQRELESVYRQISPERIAIMIRIARDPMTNRTFGEGMSLNGMVEDYARSTRISLVLLGRFARGWVEDPENPRLGEEVLKQVIKFQVRVKVTRDTYKNNGSSEVRTFVDRLMDITDDYIDEILDLFSVHATTPRCTRCGKMRRPVMGP